jgi:hypothetical protein
MGPGRKPGGEWKLEEVLGEILSYIPSIVPNAGLCYDFEGEY